MRISWILAAAAIVVAAAQFVQPPRSNPPIQVGASWEAVMKPPPDIAAMLRRSCYDCHSHQTVWPWYAHVSPVSWLIWRHVEHGRNHLNFSVWSRYGPEAVRHKLGEACEEVQAGEMPLRSYLWLHPSARLSADEVSRFCGWVRQLR